MHLGVEIFMRCRHENSSREHCFQSAVVSLHYGDGTMFADRTVAMFDVMQFTPSTEYFAVELYATV